MRRWPADINKCGDFGRNLGGDNWLNYYSYLNNVLIQCLHIHETVTNFQSVSKRKCSFSVFISCWTTKVEGLGTTTSPASRWIWLQIYVIEYKQTISCNLIHNHSGNTLKMVGRKFRKLKTEIVFRKSSTIYSEISKKSVMEASIRYCAHDWVLLVSRKHFFMIS